MKEVLEEINNETSELIGTGKVVKNSWYEVHKVNDKLYAIICYDTINNFIMHDSLIEITEEQISEYI